jgi:hypothetical protein
MAVVVPAMSRRRGHLHPVAARLPRRRGHANVRVTLDMYVGATAGVLDRARTATQ